jgi:hypothetical protein
MTGEHQPDSPDSSEKTSGRPARRFRCPQVVAVDEQLLAQHAGDADLTGE